MVVVWQYQGAGDNWVNFSTEVSEQIEKARKRKSKTTKIKDDNSVINFRKKVKIGSDEKEVAIRRVEDGKEAPEKKKAAPKPKTEKKKKTPAEPKRKGAKRKTKGDDDEEEDGDKDEGSDKEKDDKKKKGGKKSAKKKAKKDADDDGEEEGSDNDDKDDKKKDTSAPAAAAATNGTNGNGHADGEIKSSADVIAKFAGPLHKLDSDAILALVDAKPKGVKRGKPATEADIAKVEAALEVKFPAALRAIYLKYNGIAGKEEGEAKIGNEEVSLNSPIFYPLIKATEPLEDKKFSLLNFNKFVRSEGTEDGNDKAKNFWKKHIVFGTDAAMNIEEHDVPTFFVGLEDGIVYRATDYIWDVSDPREAYEPMGDFTEYVKKFFDAIAKELGDSVAAAPPAVAGAPPAGADGSEDEGED